MRISDWSSDVCSSDLELLRLHLPVARWVKPQEFVEFKEEAERIGFLGVLAGPLVRSSYRAGRLWAQSILSMGREIPPRLAHLAADIAAGDRSFAQAV